MANITLLEDSCQEIAQKSTVRRLGKCISSQMNT